MFRSLANTPGGCKQDCFPPDVFPVASSVYFCVCGCVCAMVRLTTDPGAAKSISLFRPQEPYTARLVERPHRLDTEALHTSAFVNKVFSWRRPMTGCSVSGSVWAEWGNSGPRRSGKDGDGGAGSREKEKLVRQTRQRRVEARPDRWRRWRNWQGSR